MLGQFTLCAFVAIFLVVAFVGLQPPSGAKALALDIILIAVQIASACILERCHSNALARTSLAGMPRRRQ